MDIETLKDFIALAKYKSFSKTAAARYVTQPAFSRRIRTLEESLETDLVDRKTKNFQLTPAGERFLTHAQNLVDVATRAIDDTKSLMTRLRQPVYISAPSHVSKTFFPDWYKSMQHLIPDLSLRISNQRGSGAIDDLHKGLADLALILDVRKSASCYNFDGLEKCFIGSDALIAVRARHAGRNNLLMHERGSYMSVCADMSLGKKYKNNEVVFESSSTGLLKEMAVAGFGIAVLPESLVEDDLSQGYLVQVEGTAKLKADIVLVRTSQPSNKKVEKLWSANMRIEK